MDMAATPGVISKFIDGVKAADQTDADGSGLDGRFALSDVAHLFSEVAMTMKSILTTSIVFRFATANSPMQRSFLLAVRRLPVFPGANRQLLRRS